jgi:hypothetical protein
MFLSLVFRPSARCKIFEPTVLSREQVDSDERMTSREENQKSVQRRKTVHRLFSSTLLNAEVTYFMRW